MYAVRACYWPCPARERLRAEGQHFSVHYYVTMLQNFSGECNNKVSRVESTLGSTDVAEHFDRHSVTTASQSIECLSELSMTSLALEINNPHRSKL